MEFHAPSFGDGFDLNQYANAVTQSVAQSADVVTTSYYVPSTQSFVQSSPALYQPTQVTVSEADMMAFGQQGMWQSSQGPIYTQTLTNLSSSVPQQVHVQSQVPQNLQQQQQSIQPLQQPQSVEAQRESSPMAGSPDSYGNSSGGGPIKKQKAAKKKKDPNEPKKPLSAYAMFFRDTQAAIKGQNPSASFGEVSKVVAQMWESLDLDKKNQYKQKAEDAKKDYLKALTAYKASLVAQSGGGQDSLPSPPQAQIQQLSQPVMIESHHPAQWAAQQMAQQPQQPVQIIYAPHNSVQQLATDQYLNSSHQQAVHSHSQYNHATLNVQVPMAGSQVGQQMLQHSPPQQNSMQQNIVQMNQPQLQQLGMGGQQMMGAQEMVMNGQIAQQVLHMQPKMEGIDQRDVLQSMQHSPGHDAPSAIKTEPLHTSNSIKNESALNGDSQDSHSNFEAQREAPGTGNEPVAPSSEDGGCIHKPKCIRNGCVNAAVDSADWDKEYCSNECVVSHCREVFSNWVGQRQSAQATGPPVVSQ